MLMLQSHIIRFFMAETAEGFSNITFFLLERDRHNFLSFWTMFCPFTPLTSPLLHLESNTVINIGLVRLYPRQWPKVGRGAAK